MANDEHIGPTEEEWEKLFGRTTKNAVDPFGPPEANQEGNVRDFSKRRTRDNVTQERKSRYDSHALRLYDCKEVHHRMEAVKGQRDAEHLYKCLSKMYLKDGTVLLVPQPPDFQDILNELNDKYPHFEEVTDFFRQRMRLNALKKHPILDFGVNILLDGPAGCGKTSYLLELSKAMNTEFKPLDCASMTNGFDLTGMSQGWSNGHFGSIHHVLVEMACGNPLFLLDEIDKAGGEQDKHNFMGSMYSLLEKNSAKEFRDEYVDVKIDASRINFFATSNDESKLTSPIRDRFEVLKVRSPNREDLLKIIPLLYTQSIDAHELQGVFSSELEKGVLDKLLALKNTSIRRIKSTIETALANAAVRVKKGGGVVLLKPEDIPDIKLADGGRQKMGFIH